MESFPQNWGIIAQTQFHVWMKGVTWAHPCFTKPTIGAKKESRSILMGTSETFGHLSSKVNIMTIIIHMWANGTF